jgi:amino acid transporter
MGAALYLAPEVCFIGAISPKNVAHNWLNPFGSAGSFGPYYTLATSVGLGWLGTILIIDALISPGGTGLVYLASTSRLSYSLARVRFLPPVFSSIDRRGVPWFSILFGGVFGCFLFLPFGGWAKLVGAITAASSFMYGFAPIAAVSLRRSDPDRERPY